MQGSDPPPSHMAQISPPLYPRYPLLHQNPPPPSHDGGRDAESGEGTPLRRSVTTPQTLDQGHQPQILRTLTCPPIRYLEALSLSHTPDEEDEPTPASDLQSRLNACFKAHQRTTRLLLKHARNQRRLKDGKALLRMFIKNRKLPCNPSYALQRKRRTLNSFPQTSRS